MSGFGQSNNTTFGSGGTSGGFGQSNNNSAAGSAFGSSSVFGQQQSTTTSQSQPFGSAPTTPAPTNTFGSSGGSGFGTSNNTSGFGAAPASTPFGSSNSTAATTGGFGSQPSGFGGAASSTTTPSFGFGQQQQQQQQQQTSAFGTSSTSTSNAFGSSTIGSNNATPTTSSSSSAPLAFGSSSTVAATPNPSVATPAPSVFGGASATTTTTTAVGATAGNNVTPSTPFGTAATSTTSTSITSAPFGGGSNQSNTTSTPFGSSAFGSSTPSSTNTGIGGGFGSSGFGTSTSTTNDNLSASAAPFTPAATTTTSGFGMSSSTSTAFGGTSDKAVNSTSSGFGGTTNSGFGSGFGVAQPASTSTSSSTTFGGGFGTQATSSTSTSTPFGKADDNNSRNNEATSSSFPFGSRIPRKEKSKNKPSDQEGGGDESKSSSTEGDAQLAALRAKIQEKKQRLLDKKKMQQQQQQEQHNSPTRSATTSDGDRNVELAAKNALRFASQQENKGLSSLLPTDLQSRAQEYDASAPVTDTSNNNDANIGDDDDLAHRNVNNAKSLIGTCASMCPDEELLRREREGDIQLLEITDPGGLHPAHWTLRDTAVKRFRRSAADFKLDIPELVRPPEVLERVCGYLEEWVMERDRQGPDKRWMQAATTNSDCPPSLDVYQFIWDRTRMIRKDFILQNYIGTGGKCDARAVRCHERIARWHTMCEHQLSHIPDFVQHQSQQNIAELGQTMKTLNLYYDDVLGRALTEPSTSSGDPQGCVSDIVMGKSPTDFDGSALSNDAQSSDVSQRIIGQNGTKSPTLGTAEPEMRGLYILLTMNNEGGMEVLKYSGRLCTQKPDIFYSKPVQLALTIFQAKKDHNYAKFFRLLRCPSTPYLFACIMFKYVENMRKDTLFLMSRVYGAKHKTTGEAFYDSYPLEKLVNLLCYEDESEAKEACRHYGITVKDDQVLWRHSKFREPRDPDKGHILSLKPRKMIRTIESKLKGATRLSVCRGGVSGEGATLSKTSTSVDAEALLRDRQKAQEEMKQKLAEAKAREEAERQKQEQIKKEKLRQERLAAEKRAKEEEARKAEQERLRKEQLERDRLEKERLEKERLVAEAKTRKEAAERAERLRLEKEAREKKEREIAEAKRLAEEERQRKLAEEERIRRLEEEKRRREEEERRRIAAEAERRRRAEEERIRKAKEEEERRIEMAWRQKVENARKILICRLLRKQMRRHDSLQKSRKSLSKLDPTCTHYPTSDVELCRDLFFPAQTGAELVSSRIGSCDDLESQMYRLATLPRQPMDLSKVVAECLSKSSSSSCQLEQSYPPVVRTSHVKLFKLAILLPERTPQFDQLCKTVQMWVESHIVLDEVSSFEFTTRGNQFDARTVAVISNEEDVSQCRDCDAALVLLPSVDETDSLHYSEAAQQLLDQNVPRMVLVLDANDGSQRCTTSTERLMDTVLGCPSSSGAGLQREGVAAPNLADLDTAFQNCCEVLVQAHVDATTLCNDEKVSTVGPSSLVRVPLSDVGFLCLQQLIRNMDETGFFKDARQSTHETLFDVCKSALGSLSLELYSAYEGIRQDCHGRPSQEFFDSGSIDSFFGEDRDLPEKWLECNPNIGDELNSSFQHLLEHSTLTLFVESIVDSLPGNLRHDLLTMLDNGDLSACLSSIVTMVVTGEINLISDEQTMIYLPATALFTAIDRAAAYQAPESVDQRADVPDYLLYGLPEIDDIVEEKENRIVEKQKDSGKAMTNSGSRMRSPEERKGNNATKRSRNSSNHEPNLALLQDNEESRRKKAKRSILNEDRKVETEEERSSKSFTSYLQALLG